MEDKERKDLIKKGRWIMDWLYNQIEQREKMIKEMSIEILNLKAGIEELKKKTIKEKG